MSDSPAMTYFAELGRALRIFRDRAKLTGAEVAERAEMGKAQLSKYETGAEVPNLRTLAKLLDALEVEPLWFFYLIHQLSRGQSVEALKADLLHTDSGLLFSAGEPEAFRRLLESVFEVHSAVITGRVQSVLEAGEGKKAEKELAMLAAVQDLFRTKPS
jgi:transcriptional regulator with XRE-family HTH domain